MPVSILDLFTLYGLFNVSFEERFEKNRGLVHHYMKIIKAAKQMSYDTFTTSLYPFEYGKETDPVEKEIEEFLKPFGDIFTWDDMFMRLFESGTDMNDVVNIVQYEMDIKHLEARTFLALFKLRNGHTDEDTNVFNITFGRRKYDKRIAKDDPFVRYATFYRLKESEVQARLENIKKKWYEIFKQRVQEL